MPTPGFETARYGGNTSCVTIELPRPDGPPALFILDAGTGIRLLGLALLREKRIPLTAHLFLSHTHWDHIQGFPFFAPAFMPGNKIVVYGGAGTDDELAGVLTGQMLHRYFPVSLDELGSEIVFQHTEVSTYEIEGVRVRVASLHHPGGTVGYRFETPGGVIVYCTDTEPICDDAKMAQTLGAAHLPLDLSVVELAHGADVLIYDAQYTDAEYPAGRVGWGHSPITFAVRTAQAAGVRRLVLFHHDPTRTDEAMDALLVGARDCATRLGADGLRIDAAQEGMEIRFPVRQAARPSKTEAVATVAAPAHSLAG